MRDPDGRFEKLTTRLSGAGSDASFPFCLRGLDQGAPDAAQLPARIDHAETLLIHFVGSRGGVHANENERANGITGGNEPHVFLPYGIDLLGDIARASIRNVSRTSKVEIAL